ncbi:hypothetical protein [Campylobacter pinnipediorum]|uniref:hypothetical protein n=1 Tax=Campylobacter pinnipediorum TaxID=1965231 RepID=UPI00084D1550|nr:hypothetical protein [Campylobacter pinnipediorum]
MIDQSFMFMPLPSITNKTIVDTAKIGESIYKVGVNKLDNIALKKLEKELPKGYTISKNGIITSLSGKNYIYSGANDIVTNKLVLQQIEKGNKPIKNYMISITNNSYIKTIKPKPMQPNYYSRYEVGNKFLKNQTKYNQMGIDFIESYAPTGIPAASLPGITGWIASDLRERIQDSIKELNNIIKNINEHLNKEKDKDAR